MARETTKSRTISESTKRKTYHSQFSLALTNLDRMLLEFYAERSGEDKGDIMRFLLRAYVRGDSRFDLKAFQEWAEKVFIPQEPERAARAILKADVENCAQTLGLEDRSKSRITKKGA